MFIIFSANSLYISRISFLNLLSASRFFYRFTICLANSPWINYLFRAFTINSLSFSRSLYEFAIFYANSRRIHYEITIFFAISLGNHNVFREFTMNTLSISRIHLESTFFREIAMNSLLTFSRFYFEITILFPKSPSIIFFLRNQYKFTICFQISQWNHYLFRQFTLNPRFSPNHHGITIFYAKSLKRNYLWINTLN